MARQWPVLLIAAAMLIAGGWQAVATGTGDTLAAFGAGCLVGAGLTLLGAWAMNELNPGLGAPADGDSG